MDFILVATPKLGEIGALGWHYLVIHFTQNAELSQVECSAFEVWQVWVEDAVASKYRTSKM